MIHIFDLTPEDTQIEPSRDRYRFLEGCEIGPDGLPNFMKYPLNGVSWRMVDSRDTLAIADHNSDIWDKIFKGVEKRVNDDIDGDDPIVYCIVNTPDRSLLATIIEGRNRFLEFAESEMSNASLETAKKYTKIWVPITIKKFNKREQREKWICSRWLSL